MKLKYIRLKDILALFVLFFMLPISWICKIFMRNVWLIAEDENECRDNGYWFFLFCNKNHPEQKVYYAINKKCADYQKIKEYKNVIQWGSFKHWLYYLCAKKNILTQKGGKPNAAAFYLFEVKIPILSTHRVFLQHGITKDNATWLYQKNCRFELFVCAAKDEYDYILEKFGYTEKNCALLGFSRYDNLNDELLDKDYILFMPSWRESIARKTVGKDVDSIDYFKETDYYKRWNELLSSPKLNELLEKSNKKVIFYPHRNMQKYLSAFDISSKNIIVASSKDYDVQELLKKCGLLVTDYSSIFFDFGYMQKPIIFYQFEYEEFRKYQYQEGYFDYSNNAFGKSIKEVDGVIEEMDNFVQSNLDLSEDSKFKLDEFFTFHDNLNSQRIYEYLTKRR